MNIKNKQNSYPWMIFAAVNIVAIMINLDMTVVNLALVTIAKQLHASLKQMQWIINGYMLANITLIVVVGKIADIISKKHVYLSGIVIFAVASLLAALSTTPQALICARILQGVGFASTLTLGIIIITDTFPSKRLGFILSCYMTVAGLSQALGPTIGGAILEYMHWQWIFLINIPLGLLATTLILVFYKCDTPSPNKYPSNKQLSFIDIIILGSGLLLLTVSLNQFGTWGLDSKKFIFSVLSSLGILIFFYWKEKKSASPLLDFSLFHKKNYLLINIIRFIYMYCWISILFTLPLYLQNIIGLNPLHTGLLLFCMTIMFAATSPIAAMLLDKVGFKKATFFALVLSLISCALFANLGPTLSPVILITSLIIFGISAPIMGSASAAIALNTLSAENKGMGMGVFYTLVFFGVTVGTGFSGSIINLVSHHYFLLLKTTTHLNLANHQTLILRHIINGSHSLLNNSHLFSSHQIKQLTPLIHKSFIYGFSTVMWINAGLSVISLWLCSLLRP